MLNHISIHLLKTYYVRNILIYGNETWTITIEEQKIIRGV